ncbi:RdgB/HAM1 family non-canonical purine NTP pyrophosphatase [Neisseria sp. Ec49-e6-T10]|uniref:RdgB/HAM1 family non-canonical purine NTP pyrophosphatase n=1 Tax=Neisseria sp. Ec49-e6-T10 TaxID=3140744 RepID=UPI003EC15097
MFDKLVLASNNAGKLREIQAFFEPYRIEVIPQGQLNVPECPEPHFTFLENALAKARHASEYTGLPALADDSGICATALNGAPGVLSARFAGEEKSDQANNQKLVQVLAEHENKEVWYVCSLVLVRNPMDPQPIIADGVWQGEFIDQPKGDGGFGYDPHFFLTEYRQTVSELSATIKNRLSHRGQALTMLMDKMDVLYERAGLAVPEDSFHVTCPTDIRL